MQKRRLIGSCVIVGLAIGMLSGCGKAATDNVSLQNFFAKDDTATDV